MSEEDDTLEAYLIDQELKLLSKPDKVPQRWGEMQSAPSIWSESHPAYSQSQPHSDPNKHRFNHYADKQLTHLVVIEQFDFGKIASLLNYIFREERARFTETSCRERWEQLHVLRENEEAVRLKRMEDKRASSVSSFSDPYSLYNLEEMLDRLQQTEQQHSSANSSQPQPQPTGYNIFKNSIRQIDDMEGYKQREKEMLSALNQAQDPLYTIQDKLMHFSPYYDRLNQFEVKEQELTQEKMKEIMSIPIEIQSLQMELRPKDMNQSQKDPQIKRTKREEQRSSRQEHKYDIQEDWDEYESD